MGCLGVETSDQPGEPDVLDGSYVQVGIGEKGGDGCVGLFLGLRDDLPVVELVPHKVNGVFHA